MSALASYGWDVLAFLLVLWATTGLTVIHLGVLGWRYLKGLRRRRPLAMAPRVDPDAPLPPLTLTFLVPVYNDGLTVGPTIESLLRQTRRPDRILVVNDGSTDATRDILNAYARRGVDVLHLPQNVGKTKALEHALQHVRTDLVAITDADSIVHQDYVRQILGTFRDPQVAAVGGAVESIPHTWITAARQIEYMITVNVDRNAETDMNALVVLPGVSTTYRTAVLKEMGFEHDTIAEDFDMTFRLQLAKKRIVMNLDAKVYTSDPPTLKSYYKQVVRWYTDFWLVLRKHRRVLGKGVFGTVEVPMLVLNTALSSLLYLVLPIYFLFADPGWLMRMALVSLALDTALVILAARVYRRHDVWWSLASRIPTRLVGRYAYVLAMTRVLLNRPGKAWDKLERRGTAGFLASSHARSDGA